MVQVLTLIYFLIYISDQLSAINDITGWYHYVPSTTIASVLFWAYKDLFIVVVTISQLYNSGSTKKKLYNSGGDTCHGTCHDKH